MNKIINLIVIFSVTVFSCLNFEKKTDNYSLEEIESVSITIDSTIDYNFRYIQEWYDNDIQYFVILNYINPSIHFYNAQTKQIDKKINLDQSGPNAIENPRGLFHI
jgi:hypothetical protein